MNQLTTPQKFYPKHYNINYIIKTFYFLYKNIFYLVLSPNI